MDAPKAQSAIETRTLEALLAELGDIQRRLGPQLEKLESAKRFSDAYHDALAEVYTQLTWLECLARDLKAEIDRIDDQLPED